MVSLLHLLQRRQPSARCSIDHVSWACRSAVPGARIAAQSSPYVPSLMSGSKLVLSPALARECSMLSLLHLPPRGQPSGRSSFDHVSCEWTYPADVMISLQA